MSILKFKDARVSPEFIGLVTETLALKEAKEEAENEYGGGAVAEALALIAFIYDSPFGQVDMRWGQFVWGDLHKMETLVRALVQRSRIYATEEEHHFLVEVVYTYMNLEENSGKAFDRLGKVFFPRKK